METAKTNKRLHKRFMRRCAVEFFSHGITCRGISGNCSLNGLFIRTSCPLALDTILHLTVFLPDGTASKLKVKVIRAGRTSPGKLTGAPVKSGRKGVGAKIIERDANYLHFFRSLLNSGREKDK